MIYNQYKEILKKNPSLSLLQVGSPCIIQIREKILYCSDSAFPLYLFREKDLLFIKECIENTLKEYKENGIDDSLIDKLEKEKKIKEKEECDNIINTIKEKKEIKPHADSLYLIRDIVLDKLKIGRSFNVKARLKQLQIATSNKLEVLYVVKEKGYLEPQLHAFFNCINTNGEWFENDGQIIKYFKEELL